jgi:hypothetical protein
MEIRSYRRVFELERRIYRIDRLRLNPGGVPVRGVVYFLALFAVSMAAASLPLTDVIARAAPWYLRSALLPAGGAALLAVIRIEGRPFHHAAYALIRYRLGPRQLVGVERRGEVGTRWWPHEVLLLPDGSDARMRRLRFQGPGAALVMREHERIGEETRSGFTPARRSLTLRELPHARVLSRGEVVALARGARLLVRPAATSRPALEGVARRALQDCRSETGSR